MKVNLNLNIIVLSAYLLDLTSVVFLPQLQISSCSTLKPDDIQYCSSIYILQVKFHFQT
jgi:hypothetical protein